MEFFRKNKTAVIMAIIALGVVIMWVRSCRVEKPAGDGKFPGIFGGAAKTEEMTGPQEVIPVKIAKVVRTDFKDTLPALGTIKGFNEIPVKFMESGRIDRFHFKEGEQIKEGDLIVSQEQTEARLKREYVAIEHEKNKKIHALGGITDDKLKQSELELESAQWEVDKRNFYAPFDGYMGSRLVEEGEMVTQSDGVTTFITIGQVYCEIGTIEKDMNKVRPGQTAGLTTE